MTLRLSVLTLSYVVPEQMFTLSPSLGVLTRLSNTVMVTGQLPILTPQLALSTLVTAYWASLQVRYLNLNLTFTQ